MRWCPKPNCGTGIRAQSLDAQKLDCPSCGHSICFQCREEWHGYWTSCDAAMEQRIVGWSSNRDVSFCPMCRTKIERLAGCNHMTCLYCEYEFCWFCKADASSQARHWRGTGGCGAGMFDEAPPSLTSRVCSAIWLVIGELILTPLAYLLLSGALIAVALHSEARERVGQ